MTPELGHMALIVALSIALLQFTLPLVGYFRHQPLWMDVARPLALLQFAFVVLSYLCLTGAFIRDDFSVLYVANNSNSQLPMIYKICAVWGAHEGSLLLWITLLSFWTALVACFNRSVPRVTSALSLSVLGFISMGFLLFILFTSNPFVRLLPNTPLDGGDLNPLLQDPGLIIHPPMLYTGYVGFAVAFAFAISALIRGQLDSAWARWVRPWCLLAWLFLTFGIILGSWWAYYELGWGGWWFWDPVENASFMPWLLGSALLHALAAVEHRGVFKGWAVLLAICTFAFSLIGTFIVRSGVLTSVHAFASDPTRGLFILAYLICVVGGALLIYGWRAPKLHSAARFSALSRETFMLSNNILLVVMCTVVCLGTLYPLLISAMSLQPISIGPPYFNTLFIPLGLLLMLLMVFAPLSSWQVSSLRAGLVILPWTLLVSVIMSVLLPWWLTHTVPWLVVLGLFTACWLILSTVSALIKRIRSGVCVSRSFYGMVLAHIGVAVTALGLTLTSHYALERDVRIHPGEQVTLSGYTFLFTSLKTISGPNYDSVQGRFLVSKNGRHITTLQPEKRYYTVQKMPLTETALAPGFFRDLYVALGEPLAKNKDEILAGDWAVRIYYKPFVRWIWLGGLLMMVGGALSASDRRYRKRAKRKNAALHGKAVVYE